MVRARFVSLVITLGAVAALLAACGSDSPPASAGQGDRSPSVAAGDGGSNPMTGGGVATSDVQGVGTVLVDADGFTLYYFLPDEQGDPTCTGDCAASWPPAIVDRAPSAGDLPKEVSTVQNPESGDRQLAYDGWPLYRYAGDTQPGQATGQGVGDVWFAMTPDGVSAQTSASGPKY